MAGMDVEQLNIRIQSDASSAVSAIDNLIGALGRLNHVSLGDITASLGSLSKMASAIGTLGGASTANIVAVGNSVGVLSESLKTIDFGDLSQLKVLGDAIGRLNSAGKNGQSVVAAGQAVKIVSDQLRDIPGYGSVETLNAVSVAISKLATAGRNGQSIVAAGQAVRLLASSLQGVTVDPAFLQMLSQLATAIASLASRTGKRYSEDFIALADGLERLFQVLARAPTISAETIRAIEAVSRLDSENVKAANGFMRMADSADRGASSLRNYSNSAGRGSSFTHSFASRLAFAIGRFRQIYYMVRRIATFFGKMVESAMEYVEVLNYFNAAFEQVASRSRETFGDAGQEAGEAFTNRFAAEAEKLTEKMSGYSVSASGMVVNTMGTTLGMNPATMMNYQAVFAQMASSMGVSSDVAVDLSRALTEIGADLASVRNMDFETTWKNLQSGLVGMSRAVDKFGVNIRNVNLQQKLTDLGIKANIQSMNQQDKALLRTIIILENSQYAWGDLADTLQQPANQMRMLRSGLSNLGRTIGNLLLPIVAAALPYINAFVIALQKMFETLVGLMGIEFDWGSMGGAAIDSEWADYLEDTADGFTAAADAAEEYKNQLLGFDEINKLGNESGSGSSADGGAGGAIASGALENALRAALDAYQKVWDESYANVNNRINEIAQNIIDWFGKIKVALQPALDALKRLWDEVLVPLGQWKWEALKDFYNRFLKPVGEWVIGEGIPKLVDVLVKLYNDIDWDRLSSALKKLWDVLKPFTIGVFEGFIKFCEVLEPLAALTFNAVIDVFTVIGDVLSNLDPEVLELLGQILGVVLVGGATAKMLKLGKVIPALVGKGAVTTTAATTAATTATAAAPALFTKTVATKTLLSAAASYIIGEWVTSGYRGSHPTNTGSKAKDVLNTLGEWGTAISAAAGAGAITGAGVGSAVPGLGTLAGAVAGIGAGLIGTMFSYRDSTGKTAGDYIKLFGQNLYSSVLNSLGIKVPQAVQTSANNVKQSLTGSNGTRGFSGSFKSGLEETERVIEGGFTGSHGTRGISGSFNTGILSLQTIANSGVNGVFSGIKSLISTSAPEVSELIEAAGRASAAKAGEAGTSAKDAYASGFGSLGTEISQKLNEAQQIIRKHSAPMTADAKTAAANTKKGFTDTLGTIGTELHKSLSGMNNTIGSILSYGKVKASLGGVVTAFHNTFGEAMNAAVAQYNAMASNMNRSATMNGTNVMRMTAVPMAYANGGMVEDGFFFANSHELIGTFSNGRTAVANNEQIIAGIEGGVARGMAQVLMSGTMNGGQNGQPVEVTITVDSETLYRATLRGQSKYNNRYHMTTR